MLCFEPKTAVAAAGSRVWGLSMHRIPHLAANIGSHVYTYMHTSVKHIPHPGIDRASNAYVSSTSTQIAPPPKYRGVAVSTVAKMLRSCFIFVLTHLFVARFTFQRYRISSLTSRFLDYLVRNYAKRQNRFQRRFIIRISRLIFRLFLGFLSSVSQKYGWVCNIYIGISICNRQCVSSVREQIHSRLGNIVVVILTQAYTTGNATCACFILFWRVSRKCVLGRSIAMEIGYSRVTDGLRAKRGRCDNNCVFNGAGYTLVSRIYSRK